MSLPATRIGTGTCSMCEAGRALAAEHDYTDQDLMTRAAELLHDQHVRLPEDDTLVRAVLHSVLASRQDTTTRIELARAIIDGARSEWCRDCFGTGYVPCLTCDGEVPR